MLEVIGWFTLRVSVATFGISVQNLKKSLKQKDETMPNRHHESHAKDPRKLASGRWQARVTYYDPETGKRHETSQTFATEREAKKWSREQEMAYRDDPNRKPPSEITFAEFFAQWIDGVATARTRDTTIKAYRRYAKPLIEALGHRSLKTLTTGDFQSVISQLVQLGRATSTIHHTYVVAHSSLDTAVTWGLIPVNPVDRVKPPRVVSPEIVPPTVEEARRLLEATASDRLHALWVFIALTGCRKGEAMALKWPDINWAQHTVVIRRTVAADGGLLSIHDAKTVKGRRTIALSDYLITSLRDHEHRQSLEQEWYGPEWNPEQWVFPSEKGTVLWPSNVNRRFRLLRQEAGLSAALRPHDLRHAMATSWLNAGVPIKVVSERLGHASIAITLQIYGHLLPTMQADAAQKMDAWISDLPSLPSPFHPHEPKKPS